MHTPNPVGCAWVEKYIKFGKIRNTNQKEKAHKYAI